MRFTNVSGEKYVHFINYNYYCLSIFFVYNYNQFELNQLFTVHCVYKNDCIKVLDEVVIM